MSKFTNVVKSGSRKVTRSVPVFTAKNVVEDVALRTRIRIADTQQSRDRYYALKDEAKEQKRQERAAEKERLAQEKAEQEAREQESVALRSQQLRDAICPDEVIPASETTDPVHVSNPLAAVMASLLK